MQRFTSLVMLITSLLFTSSLFAFITIDTMRVNGGVDVGAYKQDFETSFGKDHFTDHYPYTNIYLGLKFNPYVGIEGGYEHIYRQDEKTFYPVLNGVTVPVLGFFSPLNTDPVFYLSDMFSKSWHLNLVGYWPICPNKTDLMASIGIAWLKMYIDTVAISDPTVATEVVRFASDNKALARATIGIKQMITQHFGARLQFLWENTSKIEAATFVPLPLGVLEPTTGQDNYTVKPKNSYGADIGFFFELP
ncbi:MAG: hypothetical protein JSS07_02885 [Proteobacteria bacterium]|nr:hypothetical protein [Pseudomonadota bacterium]